MKNGVSIGEAARQSGVKVPTIRYYEQIGLLPAPHRLENNRRLYEPADLRRLAFIRHSRELGFGIEAIRTLVSLQETPSHSCTTADAIAKLHLAEVNQRIRSLSALRDELEAMIERCKHGRIAECRVIEVLANHGECRHEHGAAL